MVERGMPSCLVMLVYYFYKSIITTPCAKQEYPSSDQVLLLQLVLVPPNYLVIDDYTVVGQCNLCLSCDGVSV